MRISKVASIGLWNSRGWPVCHSYLSNAWMTASADTSFFFILRTICQLIYKEFFLWSIVRSRSRFSNIKRPLPVQCVRRHIFNVGVLIGFLIVKIKVKAKLKLCCTGLDKPVAFQEVEALRFPDNRHVKVIKLSALRTDRLYSTGTSPGTSGTQDHSAVVRIKSMKNSSDSIGYRTRSLPACSAVLQPTTAPPPSAPFSDSTL
jgi:hypothetical protein